MARGDAERVRQGYEAFTTGDLPSVLEFLDEDILVEDRVESPDHAIFHGRDGFVAYLTGWLEAWDEFHIELEDLIEAGDEIVALVHQHGKGKGSAIRVDESLAHVWTARDGQAVRFRVYTERQAALRAVGLGESSVN